ncbi:hypothetical protein ACFFX0_23870 [Citricoccus parietis]|uniref:Uncharacterized protein n=1 Tax=Citricoccus parietis TaxID=592307 RepID=A0ABV5G556_9MICC
MAEPFEDADGGQGDLGIQGIHDAGGEQGDSHGTSENRGVCRHDLKPVVRPH